MVQTVRSISGLLQRQQAGEFIESQWMVRFITTLILINAVTLGLETNDAVVNRYGPFLTLVDAVILIVFTLELLIKFYAQRTRFFQSGWNWFDLIIVVIAWIPASGPFAILRALRILRVLRLLSVIPQMRRVISAIGHSIPGMLSIVGVLGILFYVCAVLATKLFGQHEDPQLQLWFGTLGASAYTLFQVMTLESWSMGIVRPVMIHYPWAWVFFVPFIIVTSFAVLNLFIGIIVDAMQVVQGEDRAANADSNQGGTLDSELELRLETLQKSVDQLTRELVEQKKGSPD